MKQPPEAGSGDPAREPDVEMGSISAAEFRFLLRGLNHVKQTLLDEAGDLAAKKLSRKDGGLLAMIAKGRDRLEQVRIIDKLCERMAVAAQAAGLDLDEPSSGGRPDGRNP